MYLKEISKMDERHISPNFLDPDAANEDEDSLIFDNNGVSSFEDESGGWVFLVRHLLEQGEKETCTGQVTVESNNGECDSLPVVETKGVIGNTPLDDETSRSLVCDSCEREKDPGGIDLECAIADSAERSARNRCKGIEVIPKEVQKVESQVRHGSDRDNKTDKDKLSEKQVDEATSDVSAGKDPGLNTTDNVGNTPSVPNLGKEKNNPEQRKCEDKSKNIERDGRLEEKHGDQPVAGARMRDAGKGLSFVESLAHVAAAAAPEDDSDAANPEKQTLIRGICQQSTIATDKVTGAEPTPAIGTDGSDGVIPPTSDDRRNNPRTKGKSTSVPLTLFPVILTLAILIIGPVREVGGMLTIVPQDTVVHSGTTVRLTCTTNLQEAVFWERISFPSKEHHTIYFGTSGMAGFVGKRFRVDASDTKGRYDLVIRDVQASDAGTYMCIDDSGIGHTAKAELIVAENLTCEMPIPKDGFMGENIFGIPEDVVSPSCSLRFHGHRVPHLYWNWTGAHATGRESFMTNTASSVKSTLTLPATKDLNGAVFRCGVAVSEDEVPHRAVELQWKSNPITVKYAKFESAVVDSCPGVGWIPICNPRCTYEWEPYEESGCRCVSIYRGSNGHTYNVTIGNIACDPVGTTSSLMSVALSICIIVVIITMAIGGILLFVRYKYQSKKKRSQETGSNEPMIHADVPQA